MSEYHLTPATTLPSIAVQEVKEKRRQVLEAVWQRRRENYKRFMEKRRLHVRSDLATIA